jgi:hypothetical protein
VPLRVYNCVSLGTRQAWGEGGDRENKKMMARWPSFCHFCPIFQAVRTVLCILLHVGIVVETPKNAAPCPTIDEESCRMLRNVFHRLMELHQRRVQCLPSIVRGGP